MTLVENVSDFKRDIQHYLQLAGSGEEVLIKHDDMIVAKLVPYDRFAEPWTPGALQGKVVMHTPFDAPDESVQALAS